MKTLSLLLLALALSPFYALGEKKVIEIGTKPESVCRGFGGKLYVTMLNGGEPGDGEIKVLDGDELVLLISRALERFIQTVFELIRQH